MGTVTIIPPTIQTGISAIKRELRVAAYARVSSEKDEQENSFEAQVRYYTNHIESHPGWKFVGVYADDGITGTSTKNRKGFKQLMEDVESGKIDFVLCKSISRFGRNTRDMLTALDVFRRTNVDCLWEKENVRALDGSGDFLITIYSSLAQEESHSISQNVKAGIKYAFMEGRFSMPYKHFLGYEKGPDGKPRIVEEEAKVVRFIYDEFLKGSTPSLIARELTEKGVPSPSKKERWHPSTVASILQNEKYCGRALLQKSFIPNYLDHKKVVNEGQRQQYYIENSHDGIVSREIFDIVQAEMAARNSGSRSRKSSDYLTRFLVCGDCGGYFGRKVHHSNDKYRTEIYRCNDCYKGEHKCNSARFTEERFKEMFLEALNQKVSSRAALETVEMAIALYDDLSADEANLLSLQDKLGVVTKEIENLVQKNARTGKVEHYDERYSAMAAEYDSVGTALENAGLELAQKRETRARLVCYYNALKNAQNSENGIGEFDQKMLCHLLQRAVVGKNDIDFVFQDGSVVNIRV
ncbi:MAG: recombinase family protein [Ruminococcaceae bacterium]|nr:recombinase family protein [Oscillospiraceae bacterium]